MLPDEGSETAIVGGLLLSRRRVRSDHRVEGGTGECGKLPRLLDCGCTATFGVHERSCKTRGFVRSRLAIRKR